MWKMATTSMFVFRNRNCLSLFVSSSTTLLELQTLLFLFFFQNLCFKIGGAAYLRRRLIHRHLRYYRSPQWLEGLSIGTCKLVEQSYNQALFVISVFKGFKSLERLEGNENSKFRHPLELLEHNLVTRTRN